ncbi:RNA polymerase III RPC4-domain-containing protein [Phlebopus sp. FC_14]|nr:RNA polymerase III RPC4-domain-containing protein [Phlebopus sp. FC_14]
MADNEHSNLQRNGSAGPGFSGGPKAIGSLAKKQPDVTRQGTQKLKFVPTLQPSRRKKEDVKQEAPAPSGPPVAERGTGRGRGRGRGKVQEGRGAAPRPPPVEMTASGPFAMGPALAGTSARRSAPRSNFTPVGPPGSSTLGTDLSNTAAPTLKKEKSRENVLTAAVDVQEHESDEEAYSEPDEGVEIIDMESVGKMDWMAPEALRKERQDRKRKRLVKVEERVPSLKGKEVIKNDRREALDNVDPSNALDLSESEDEEELEDLIEDFAMQADRGQDEGIRQERLLFFQFPEPFPTFVSNATPSHGPPSADVDTSEQGPSNAKQYKVSFAADVKPPAPVTGSATPSVATDAPTKAPKVDGIIGQLEVYRSGTVKMRLDNGIVMKISEATQPSFLQQAVHLDIENKSLHVVGEVNKRFVVSPDLDTLLNAMEIADRRDGNATAFDDTDLIRMDAV